MSKEPDFINTFPIVRMINYTTKTPAEISGYPENILKWQLQGFEIVTNQQWHEFYDKLFKDNERRHKRNLAKKLRRAQGKKG